MLHIAYKRCFLDIHVSAETLRYYKRKYPETATNIIYDNEQNSIESTTISEYNEYRDLVKSWDAYANGDKTNTEHMTS